MDSDMEKENGLQETGGKEQISLAGVWKCTLTKDSWEEQPLTTQCGPVTLPGCLQEAGLGYPVTQATPWISGLHNPFWYERMEYQYAQEDGCNVPFLSQPPKHYRGLAWYEREFQVPETATGRRWLLYLEKTHWRSEAYLDGHYAGEDCSLCTPHVIACGQLDPGTHHLRIGIDNSLQQPYRPDGHEVSDALGATWNGIVGELVLLTEEEWRYRQEEKRRYAKAHPRTIEVKDGQFYVDGCPEYFRGTHFGGDYPLTGYPATDVEWWRKMMRTVKSYGLNFIRFHSYCPPEAAFCAADEEQVYLQAECGMWNSFRRNSPMLTVLAQETKRILEAFGHHPSFVLFSSGNEPGGDWYQVLREWVTETKRVDAGLGYGGRRLCTAQSGWFYDVPPAQVEGTDYLYFHRSGYGSYPGGTIRNHLGWKGSDYETSIAGTRLPVVCHELGQWCAYPDFEVAEKFNGYLHPGNYLVFRENAKAKGVLSYNKEFAYCSGRNQLRLYKEDLEANLRTAGMGGFELLDLHDYLGQGGAFVGILDTFWQEKGYATPEEFRESCAETVLLTRMVKYVYTDLETLHTPVTVFHYGREPLCDRQLHWRLYCNNHDRDVVPDEDNVLAQGQWQIDKILPGSRYQAGTLSIPFSRLPGWTQRLAGGRTGIALTLELHLGEVHNHWELTVFTQPEEIVKPQEVIYTADAACARQSLEQGKTVLFTPRLSNLDYECPPVSMKNVFWNAQMGPGWTRSLGLVVESGHPVFRYFPSEESGGWQWEGILEHARGFCLEGLGKDIAVPVRVIDDWNRNLPLSLFLEAKVGKGRLLLVTADLEGAFTSRPGAFSWKRALLQYAARGDYIETGECTWDQLEAHFFSLLQTRELVEEGVYPKLFTPDPNQTLRLEAEDFPIILSIPLKREVMLEGLLYMPVQKDRMFEGCVRDYEVECLCDGRWRKTAGGTLDNSLFSQKILFDQACRTGSVRLRVRSVYGMRPCHAWRERPDGWERYDKRPHAVVQIGVLHLICNERAPDSNELFWDGRQKSATKEIEN